MAERRKILILRGSATPEPENRPKHATREPENEKFLNFINLKNHEFLNEPWRCSISAPCQWIDLIFSMRLDNINISQVLNPIQIERGDPEL